MKGIRIFMVGVGESPTTFIERQIQTLRIHGATVEILREPKHRNFFNRLFRRLGFTLGVSVEQRRVAARCDLIHYQWPAHLIQFGDLAAKLGKASVLSLRGRQVNIVPYMPDQKLFKHRLNYWLPLCSGYHAVSSAILEEGVKLGVVRDRAMVIRPAIDCDLFVPNPACVSRDTFRIAMVGALIWRKGYEYALMAIAKLKERFPNLRLTIVGEGDERDRITATVSDLDLASVVELTGKLGTHAVLQVLQNSHVFLHASLSEGIANVALEAMACGLPVVSADTGGMNEAIEDKVNGFLVAPRDSLMMARRLIELGLSDELRASMGACARQKAIEMFNLNQQGERFLQFYERVCRKYKNRIP